MSFLQKHSCRWIAALVLGVYGTAGVLGYGLHALWHCEHCHGAACDSVHAHADCRHHDHHCHHERPAVAAADDCAICAFLAQAQTEQIQETPELVTVISPADPSASESSLALYVVRLHLARGPPLA